MGLQTLKIMNLRIDGRGHLGEISKVKLPKVALKVEKWNNGLGDIPYQTTLDELKMEFEAPSLLHAAFSAMGGTGSDGAQLYFTGSYQESDGRARAVEAVGRGVITEIDMGDAETGKASEIKYMAEFVYYRLTVDGQEWFEADIPNYVLKIMGRDVMAQHRAAVGA